MTKVTKLPQRWMEKPGYQEAYTQMALEFELASAIIAVRLQMLQARSLKFLLSHECRLNSGWGYLCSPSISDRFAKMQPRRKTLF